MLDYSQFFTKFLFQGGQIDPTIISWLIILGASACAFMAGRNLGILSREDIAETTIQYLIDNKFLRAKKINGEWEILDLDEK